MIKLRALRVSVGLVFIFSSINLPSAHAGPSPSLAERLGYSADDRILIVHADDYGMNTGTNVAVEDVLSYGVVKAASIMIPAPNARDAVEASLDQDVGIHLTFNSEWDNWTWGPVAGAHRVWSLVHPFAPGARFWPDTFYTYLFGTTGDIAEEARAQVLKALEWGMKPTHIDSHMGTVLTRLSWMKAYARLAREYRIPPMIVKNSPYLLAQIPKITRRAVRKGIQYAEEHGFLLLDWIELAIKSKDKEDHRNKLIKILTNLKPGVTQLIIHPAWLEPSFSSVQYRRRGADARLFMEDSIRNLIADHGIHLIGWKEIGKVYDWDTIVLD